MNTKLRTSLIAVLAFVFIVMAILSMTTFNAFAEGEYTRDLRLTGVSVTVDGKAYNDFCTDPAYYYEEASAGYLNLSEIGFHDVDAADKIVYTANYPNTTTGRTGEVSEYVCQSNEKGTYSVVSVNNSGDGQTYIPVGGFVLSVGGKNAANFAKVGDEIVLDKQVSVPQKAVESATKRVVVNSTNTTRSEAMVVYYDYQFGAKTGTNIYGTEVTCVYDFAKNTFVVNSFRNFGTGDDSGSDIPDNSFVLSAYGEGYRGLLVRNQLFAEGDEVKLVGFDYIRFGGTVYGEYDFVNPTKEENPKGMETESSPFPAYRGENQTIVYEYGWSYEGSTGTGTNVYGYEAAVNADGVVVELGVNVSKIPEGGYVISGHGKGRDFIRSNVVLGATVALDKVNKRYSVSTTLNSYFENLVTEVTSVVTQAQQRIRQLYDVDVELLQQKIQLVQNSVEELKSVKTEIEQKIEQGDLTEKQRLGLLMNYNNYQLQVTRLQNEITTLSAESKPVSARGVWHRPVETSYAEIDENVKMYSEIGINLVFVETLYNGYSAFRTSIADFSYNPRLDNVYADGDTKYQDYLTAFVAACNKYGVEVHAWVENFYVGTRNSVPVVANHPDWLLYNDDGTTVQRNEGGAYIFLDPANVDVQNLLISYYKDLFEKVDGIKGLNLDYIRYPVSDKAEDTGYTITAMQQFAAIKGMTFNETQLASREKMARKFSQLFDANYLVGGQTQADANFQDWIDFRASIVTNFVKRIKTEIKSVYGKMLSTSVFASFTDSYTAKKQDWKTWFANGWIDVATPMAYYNNPADVRYHTENMILAVGANCYFYTGIASSYSGLPAWQNKEQIEASYMAGANGYVIFCSTQIIGHPDVQEALKSGVNSSAAVLPHVELKKVLAAYFDKIIDRANRLYIPAEGMTAAQRDNLRAKFDEILAMQTSGAVNIHKVQSAIKSLYGGSSYAKGYSGQRLNQQLKEIVALLDTRIYAELITSGEWNPETQPRPTVTDTGIVFPSNPDPTPDPTPDPDPKPSETDKTYTLVIVLWCSVGVVVLSGVAAIVLVAVRSKKNKNKNDL